MNHLTELVDRIMILKFPSPGGKEIAGVDLVMIAADTIGLSDQYIRKRGNLPHEKMEILRSCSEDLDLILQHLEGSEKYYFELHKQLAQEILIDYKEKQNKIKGNS